MLRIILLLLVTGLVRAASPVYNSENYISDNNISYIRSIFYRQINAWETGIPVTLVLLPSDDPTTKEFMASLGIMPYSYFDRMKAKMDAGDNRIIMVYKKKDVIDRVSKNVGAIGYLDQDTIVFNTNNIVKELKLK